jgi:hypothetical protein
MALTPKRWRYRARRPRPGRASINLVVAAELSGDTPASSTCQVAQFSSLLGAEYRRERSRTRFDPLDLGLLPRELAGGRCWHVRRRHRSR